MWYFKRLLWNPVKQELTPIPCEPLGLNLWKRMHASEGQGEDWNPSIETPLWAHVEKPGRLRLSSPDYVSSSFVSDTVFGYGFD